jgi:hypothetical protein
MKFILSILGGFSLQTKALLIVLVFTIGFGCGFKVSSAFEKAGQYHDTNKQLKTSDTIAKNTKAEVKKTQGELNETKIIYRTIKERIHDEDDDRICFADNAALQLWNDAIAGKDTHRSVTAGEAAETHALVATVEEVLSNAAENFETCNTNAIKHNALIDRAEALEGKMCVCTE